MIPCHSAALRCTWPFAVTCMTPSSYRERDCSPHGGCFLFSPFSSSEGRTPCDDRLRYAAAGSGEKGSSLACGLPIHQHEKRGLPCCRTGATQSSTLTPQNPQLVRAWL